jgi:hypothetical protein
LPPVDPLTELILLDEEIAKLIEENEEKQKKRVEEAAKLPSEYAWCNAPNQAMELARAKGLDNKNLDDLLNKRHSLRAKLNKRKGERK